jgi:N-acetylglucosamine-6-phosphate deacetylase
MRRAVSFGIAKEDAIRAATYNPARQIGALDQVGSIAPGKVADFIVCDEALNRKAVYLHGEPLCAEN